MKREKRSSFLKRVSRFSLAALITFVAVLVFAMAGDVIFKAGNLNISGSTDVGGNISVSNIVASGSVTAGSFSGNGSQLTGVVSDSGDNMTGNLTFAADKGIKTLVGARGYRSGTQSIPSGTWTKVNLNAESFDLGNDFDTTTNYRFNVPVSGYYQINAAIRFNNAGDGVKTGVGVWVNGDNINWLEVQQGGAASGGIALPDIQYLAAGDYAELWAYQNSGANKDISGGLNNCFLSIFLLSVA